MLRKKFAVIAFAVCAASARSAKKPITIDAVLQTEAKTRNAHAGITWAPNGLEFIVERSGMLSQYDVPSGQMHDVITLGKLENAAERTNRSEAAYEWTNRRVEASNVQWFADNRRVLVSASGDLFVVDVSKGTFDQLTKTSEVEHDPKLSPDNKYISFRRGPNLYTLAIASKSVIQLTKNGSDTLLNGELDWVYPEELEIGTAHWWSPDSRYVAYMQFDITHEPVFPQVSLLNHRAMLEPQRFPQPGDPNAEVRLGVVPATGGNTRWMNLGDPRGSLMARVAWAPSSHEIAVEKLPRIQNNLDLLLADVESGTSRVLLHEEDPQWINVKGEPQFLGDGSRLLWTSERSGFRHLYVYGIDGILQNQLTSGDWEVDDVMGVDQEHNRVFFTSTEDSPLERQLYVIGLDGSGKRRLTTREGTHSISLSPDGAYYMDDYSGLTAPPQQTLCKSDGSELRIFRPPDLSEANEYEILPTEIVKVSASDGTLLYARLIKPAGFEPGKKYPAVVIVYGGPDVQTVHNSWQGVSEDQVLAHKDFVIWQLDNRGSSGRGHKFESYIYHDLGSHELEDQKTGIQYLIRMGFVDPQRIGMFGWSYGGYMTLYTVTNAPGLIKAAIAGAPVTNYRNYDTIYTERYMGLPENNEHGYETSSPLSKAGNLQSKLLIVHNIEDDNVHFQNSVQMAAALEKAGKQFFMVVYPQRSHGVSEPFRRQLLEQTTDFFEQNLK